MSIEPRRLPDCDDVQLWLVEGFGTEADREVLLALLNEDERARWERFRVDHARHANAVSRGTLRRILGGLLDRAPESLRFHRGKYGKPYLEPTSPEEDGLEFNVSHSGELILYALRRGGPVGVDVELMNPQRPLERLARRFFAPGEARRLLEDAPAEDRLAGFYRCWTRKEAYLKAKGFGITMQLDAFEVTLLEHEPPALLHTEVAGEDPATWRVHEVPVPDGYVASLVAHA